MSTNPLPTLEIKNLTPEAIPEIVDFLTLRNIEWQNVYAFEAGKPLWTDEMIGRCYGQKTMESWKRQNICSMHGVIMRNNKCGFKHPANEVGIVQPHAED